MTLQPLIGTVAAAAMIGVAAGSLAHGDPAEGGVRGSGGGGEASEPAEVVRDARAAPDARGEQDSGDAGADPEPEIAKDEHCLPTMSIGCPGLRADSGGVSF